MISQFRDAITDCQRAVTSTAKGCATCVALDLGLRVAAIPTLIFPPAGVIFPEKVFKVLSKGVGLPLDTLKRGIMGMVYPPTTRPTFMPCFTWRLIDASVEELAFRGAIQSLLLREIPKSLLRKIAPQYETLVDHKAAKIARVVSTALIFALSHDIARMAPGMLLPQFIGGCLYACWCERRVSLPELSTIHALGNTVVDVLFGRI